MSVLLAEEVQEEDEKEDTLTMEKINVEATLDPPVIINPTQTRTSFNLEEIESRQADNIYEIIDDIPGVSLSGGPRSNGIDINIRGFGNNEDVIIKLDGAIKNFEKYRYGGVAIEPELLKRIEVSRGAASLTSGSGALGGIVEMETKDASDFLKPGQSFGFATKTGYRFNNDEQLGSMTVFAAPTPKLDLLFNVTDRDSGDFELTGSDRQDDDDALERSVVIPTSYLAKAEYYPSDDLTLGISFSRIETSGVELLDTQSSFSSFIFGLVDRDTDDKTYTSKLLYNPENDLIDFKLTFGYSDIELTELGLTGLSPPPDSITDFEYGIYALEAKNVSIFDFKNTSHTITFGIDGEYSDRETSRFISSGSSTAINQPSGIYQQYGVFLANEIQWGNLTLTPALRWDYNHSRVTEKTFIDVLNSANQDRSESFDIVLPSISAAYKFGSSPFSIFYNYWEQYRPPKIDEYFTNIRCLTNPGTLPEPQNTTTICGDLYVEEESDNYDVGLLIQKDSLWGNDKLLAKFTYFDTTVDNHLEFLNNNPNDPLDQFGKEERDGIELEINYARPYFSLNLAYAEIDGDSEGFFQGDDEFFPFIAGSGPAGGPATLQVRPIYSIPGDTLTLSTKFSIPRFNLELGWRGQHVDERLGFNENTDVQERFDSYVLHDIWANWRPFKNYKRFQNSVLRFGIDNLTNKRHRVNSGNGQGNFGLTRNYKLTYTHDF
ncbi:MAG: TonB-dependent receptor [Pseudomonadota bacterium]